MLLDLSELVVHYNLKITGVLHCGAHLGEEAVLYHGLGVENVWWIEANPFVIPKLEERLGRYPTHKVINALLMDKDHEKVPFNITNYDGMSSSIFEFGQLHLDSSPDTKFVDRVELETRTIDSLVKEHQIDGVNFLNMDLQGAELLALRGAMRTLLKIDYVYTEVNTDYVYQNCALVGELDEFLYQFTRVETGMTKARWGDALYIRGSLLK